MQTMMLVILLITSTAKYNDAVPAINYESQSWKEMSVDECIKEASAQNMKEKMAEGNHTAVCIPIIYRATSHS
jgi:hypothetical protein